jgi:hypothetical protein
MTISHHLKIKVINDYLSGMKREDIAKKYGISTGSVSAIAEEFEEEIPDIHKIRAMMIELNATGNSPKTFYHSIRLYNRIKGLGLTLIQAENILEIIQEYAFKKNHDISDLIDAVNNAYVIAQKCGTDLAHIDEHANAKAMVVEGMKTQVKKLREDIEYLPHKLNVDLAEYQEYQKNQPISQKYMQMIVERDIQDRVNKLLEDKVKNLEIQILKRDREIERLNQLSKQSKKEDGYYIDYYQDMGNFDSTDCLVDDSNSVEDNDDRL